MSYRKAWTVVQEANRAAGVPLVESAVGGKKGGGATLTARGKAALDVFEQLRADLHATAAGVLRRVTSGAEQAVHLAAAISLQEVVGQLLTEYALSKPAVRVRALFGASNELADHVLAGAPCDLFITADELHLDRLEAAGLAARGSRRVLATNGLAAVALSELPVRKPADLVKVERLALGDPASPIGKCSQRYLEAQGLFEALRPRVVYVDNSRGVLAALESGRAQVGLAFTSDARNCQVLFPAEKSAVRYCAAVVGQSTAAAVLLEFLASAPARRSFRRCGLRPAAREET
jgi:molybdate transport system substrate-binding protein